MLASLALVSLTPERAVIGHALRDKFTAEMALGHLPGLLEKTLGRKVSVSLLQLKDAPRPAPAPEPSRAQPPASAPAQAAPFVPTPRQERSAPAPAAPSSREPGQPQPPARAPLTQAELEAAKNHPLVTRAAELLNARVVRVNARSDTPAPPPAT
jgi:hypothetical protein